jgi:hypothetical protein
MAPFFFYNVEMKTLKKCTRCQTTRSTEEFRKQPQNTDQLQSWCKFCQNASKEEWRKKNMKRANAHARELYRSNPDRAKGRLLQQKFFKGLSWKEAIEKYKMILAEQAGVCAICKGTSARALHVDHCHKTGIIRGLLCHSCNLSLGRMGDSPERLRAAATYLERSKEF